MQNFLQIIPRVQGTPQSVALNATHARGQQNKAASRSGLSSPGESLACVCTHKTDLAPLEKSKNRGYIKYIYPFKFTCNTVKASKTYTSCKLQTRKNRGNYMHKTQKKSYSKAKENAVIIYRVNMQFLNTCCMNIVISISNPVSVDAQLTSISVNAVNRFWPRSSTRISVILLNQQLSDSDMSRRLILTDRHSLTEQRIVNK